MTYYMPSGSWPLNASTYMVFMKSVGYEIESRKEDADLLLLPGGTDIGLNESRDVYEHEAYEFFLKKGNPIVGICRGLQFLLTMSGEEIIQHIADVLHEIQHTTLTGHYTGESSWHKTTLGLHTNSRHHQGFIKVPDGWNVIDSTDDGIIEAASIDNIFGVQWHPEHPEMNGTDAQKWFIREMKKIIKK